MAFLMSSMNDLILVGPQLTRQCSMLLAKWLHILFLMIGIRYVEQFKLCCFSILIFSHFFSLVQGYAFSDPSKSPNKILVHPVEEDMLKIKDTGKRRLYAVQELLVTTVMEIAEPDDGDLCFFFHSRLSSRIAASLVFILLSSKDILEAVPSLKHLFLSMFL